MTVPAHRADDRPPLPRRLRKGLSRRVRSLRRWVEERVDSQSLIETTALVDNARFSWTQALEENWTTIRAELDALLPRQEALPNMQDISPTQMGITANDAWKPFFFRAYGMDSRRARAVCPRTSALLDGIPELEVAFFSVLGPRARITAHRGVYKGLVRAHLGLKIPRPVGAARMQVGDEMIRWEEGKCVVFDDTYRHEVWNDSDETRVVLLIDVHRPFRQPLAALNRTLLKAVRLTPFVRGSLRKHQAWEREFYEGGPGGPSATAS